LNTKKLTLFSLLIIGAFIISACTGQPLTNNFPGLAADPERAYMSTGSFIYAIELQTGNLVWSYPEDPDNELLYYANPVLTEDGQLLIGSTGTNHAFISLDPVTGQENWTAPFSGAKGAWVASPLVFNNTIYAPNTDGYVYVLDMSGNQAEPPIYLGGALWSAPVTDGTYIYVNSLDHHVHILDPQTGEIIEPIDIGGAAPGSPVVASDGIYVGSFASNVQFITPNGNNEVIATASDWIWGTPAFDNETLYYADLSGKLFSLDLTSNRQNWDVLQPDGPVTASLLVVGDQIYVATEAGSFIALDRDGKIVWEKTPGGKIYTTPVFANDLILVAPYQAEFALAAYDADGKQAWTFTPEN
jgi:outer membrane protein assembly factor BamB